MPGRKHEKITKVGRNHIEDGLNEGMSFSEIARVLDVQPSTVSREVRRNRATAEGKRQNDRVYRLKRI